MPRDAAPAPWPDLPLPALWPRGGPVRGFGIEHLKHVGWQAYRVESYLNWCGHGPEVIPWPRLDGLAELVPVLGEAS